jgi:hypothetical protein
MTPLLDRLLRLVQPKPDLRFIPPPRAIGPQIWAIDRRALLAGVTLPTRSTVVDVGQGRLVLVSPPADACPELDRLGTVVAVVVPNSFHYLYAKEWQSRCPTAELFYAPGLPRRVSGLPPARELTADVVPSWRERLPFVVLGPDRGISEVLFFHPASRTLILTDLASNLVDLPRAYDRIASRLSGQPAGFGPSRNARKLLLRDASRAREALRAVLQWPFERILVAHGTLVERDAADVFRSAFARYL